MGQRQWEVRVVIILGKMGREELICKLVFDLKFRGGEGVSYVEIWGKCCRKMRMVNIRIWYVQEIVRQEVKLDLDQDGGELQKLKLERESGVRNQRVFCRYVYFGFYFEIRYY